VKRQHLSLAPDRTRDTMQLLTTRRLPNEPTMPDDRSSSPPLSRRAAVQRLAAGILVAPAILRGRYRLAPGSAQEYSARAIRLVQESLVVDLLNQFRFADYADSPPKSTLWLSKPQAMTNADFEMYRTSGYNAIALGHTPADYAAGIRFFADWNGFIAGYADWFARIDDAADFDAAKKAGKVGIMITFQNSDHFRAADDVDTFFALGQRLSQLTYNYQNRIGSGFLETKDGGLTVFGNEIVERMNRVGMAVDVSHCGDRTTLDALDAAKRPVVFSHASCRALAPGHLRCKTDEMIVKMAKSGGVIGIPFLRMMVRESEPVTVEHVVDHFDHVAKLVGIEHAAVGSDMDVPGNPNPVNGATLAVPPTPNFDRYRMHFDAKGERMLTVAGLDHPKRMFDLTDAFIRRGYSDANISAILGKNASRVLSTIWAN
jgi:membrane dipeptidase